MTFFLGWLIAGAAFVPGWVLRAILVERRRFVVHPEQPIDLASQPVATMTTTLDDVEQQLARVERLILDMPLTPVPEYRPPFFTGGDPVARQ